MSLTILDSSNKDKWNIIIKSFENWDVYYLYEYVKGLSDFGDGEPILFYYTNGDKRLAYVSMKRDIAELEAFKGKIEPNQFFDMSTPYGYGGIICDGNFSENEMLEFSNELKKYYLTHGIISEFTRFTPWNKNHLVCYQGCETLKIRDTIMIDTVGSLEDIWENISNHHRRKIKQAQKNNIQILMGWSSDLFEKFKEIYFETMDRNNAVDYYYFNDEFFSQMEEELGEYATIFYAIKDTEIIAASIILFGKEYCHYHLSGIKNDYMNTGATHLLIYEAAKQANQLGFKGLHLGGGYTSNDDSLFRFKKYFNKKETLDFYIGKTIYNHDYYQRLVDIRKESDKDFDMSSSFFPQYRG